ncbi:kinase [Croceivirga sp. JEA036]|uniref:kinase n=1 Tax=Croceivirga sp. JEA036 TaxID=2721162 RepID=UPI001438A572|nr:kinase [Croceivirga sp. JEA036]NJB36356.1 kinase [Croceivirga sp. JEA036]
MFETYQNTLCIHGGWLYKVARIMPKYKYDNYCRRGPFRVMRKGRGKGSPALISWASIHEHYQQEVISLVGDPTKTDMHIIFCDYLERDVKAARYFADYLFDNGTPLAEDVQKRYAAEAAILNGIKTVINDRILRTKALGNGGLTKTWNALSDIVQELPYHLWPHSLPKNARSLQRKYKKYQEIGFEALVHQGHGHKNSEKLNSNSKQWVIGRWADQVNKVTSCAQLLDEYNERAIEKNWRVLKEEKTLYNFLHQPEIKNQWWGYRYGELKAKEKYSYQHSTKLPTMRDSLWYSDGTKLNLYYKDENGKMATCMVYEVMDAFSEVFLGYHISPTENYEAQYYAYKMAVKNSGHRPYEIKYDGAGGHKKLKNGVFLDRIAKLSIKTEPYNGKSKTIENAFYRFQHQVMKRHWYFTGQNITARAEESQANMEFILANVDNLPTLEEAKAQYAEMRKQWNQMPHFKTKEPRLSMYYDSNNPKAPAIDVFDMVDIFWVQREKPVTVTAYGISFTEAKQKHTYMVYDQDRAPDVKWLANNIDRKVTVKYDPEDMHLIWLYEDTPLGLKFLTAAETKIEISRGKQEQQDWEAQFIAKVKKANKERRIESRDTMDALMQNLGLSAEQQGLNAPHIKGLESKKRKTKESKAPSIAQVQKQVSNMEYGDLYDDY